MNFEDLINERTYKVVLLTSFIPTLINKGNVVISIDHFDDMRDHFAMEARQMGITGIEADDYIRTFITKIIGCKYSIDYLKTDTNGDVFAGQKRCYIIKALGETNKTFVNKHNKYLINLRVIDKEGKIKDRVKLVAKYRELVSELKEAVHASYVDIVGLTDLNYTTISTIDDSNKIASGQIAYVSEKIADNSSYNILVFNEDNKINKNSEMLHVYDFVKNCQKTGIIY